MHLSIDHLFLGGELSSKTGIFVSKKGISRTAVSTAFIGSDAVSGMIDGTLILWKNRSSSKFIPAHNGPVTTMYTIPEKGNKSIDSREMGPRILTGGKDGFVHMWDSQFHKLWSLGY
jgi:WD40 repeat protein